MDEELKKFEAVRTFTDNKGPISGIDFHRVEDLLVTAGDDDSIHLYNTATGTLQKTLLSKKYGVGCIAFTHHANAIICGSKNNSWDETLRYHSLHDNRYLRYFKGHRDQVVAVCMNPKNDAFLSASLDKTIRLWDLRTNACQGLLQVQCAIQPSVAYDQQGLVFAVATEDGVLKMYDARQYEKGPFTTFNTQSVMPGGKPNTFVSLQFTYDGRKILASTPRQLIVLDAYEGLFKRNLQLPNGPPHTERLLFGCSFSPDDTYIVAGAPDSAVRVW
eukprot:CAMPEP_0114224450 /NCGR_PEP_ID=MMETSP0058-20121206/114_1 /TAXON_ID=36894 /ORGANISM="Pyramimonas parkeae, CCMP726" /LENGTH=273 /DNA_ID=CAMNT_0001334927 /DNA_START=6 /DNA_END=824 /DNA_ORIENTATION=-